MPIDYSKWDNLELSDDSDVEVHPNIERGTFMRLRQQKIREDRENRRLKKERAEAMIAMNKDLVDRISQLRDQVAAADEPAMEAISRQWEQDVEQSRAFKEKRDAAIKEGTEPAHPSEEEMLAALKARVSDDLLKVTAKIDTLDAKRKEYTTQLEVHIAKLQKSLKDAERELEEVNREIATHIAPDSIAHTGFDRSFVSKGDSSAAGKAKQTVTTDEVLNPDSVGKFDNPAATTDDDVDADAIDDEGGLRIDDDAKKFASLISMSDSMDYILKHLGVVSEKKSDQIMGHAFTHQLAGRTAKAKQYVHQGLILTYILQLGSSSGVNMFFSRVGVKGSKPQEMFLKDVDARYKHIVERCKVIKSEGEQNNESEVESIQLQTDGPNAQISISVPDESNKDEDPERVELFKQLPEAFQDALKVGTIEALNEVLATTPGSEAEHILQICGQGQFLKIDEEIVVNPDEEQVE
ncbi:hsp90 co-chaperone Cdc37 [Coemansia sp. RSA 1822]|nr:hsp90 co-chaperone Cdc37 [Coemansia sp. RSA 638]KAJ2544332.1 hsp90 co-chaperone Cdc37 [Coemansia sp. RSA 1853]KAJ2566821.1 hsp90 co-chaperone Cdc37 [Coemansia sp. RSA 1822]